MATTQTIIENARVGYQVAVNLTNHEEQQMWARSSAMLLANSIIVALLGVLLASAKTLPYPRPMIILISGVGFLLSFLWFCVTERTSKKAVAWVRMAAKLEKDHLSDPVETLARGKDLAAKGNVCIHDGLGSIEIRFLGHWRRQEDGNVRKWHFSIKLVPYIMSVSFIVLYCVSVAFVLLIPLPGADDTQRENEEKRPEGAAESPNVGIPHRQLKQAGRLTKSEGTAEVLKTAVPAGATIIGVLLGYVLSSLGTWRDKRTELKNMRSILLKEMVENYRTLVRWMPRGKDEEPQADSLAGALTHLSSSVYENYLGQLFRLEEEEIHSIYSTYLVTNSSLGEGEQCSHQLRSTNDESKWRAINAHLMNVSEGTLKAIATSLLLFREGKEILEFLEEQRGKGADRMSEELPDRPA